MSAAQIVKLLTTRSETLSCAESLTGGLLCDAIVQIPGASKCFMGGIVAYDERRKVSLLNVPVSTLDAHTAVSRETVLAMACGAQERLQTTYSLSTTGYAGPDGDDVGLVWLGYAGPDTTDARECRFSGSREDIRRQAVQAALAFLAEKLFQ